MIIPFDPTMPKRPTAPPEFSGEERLAVLREQMENEFVREAQWFIEAVDLLLEIKASHPERLKSIVGVLEAAAETEDDESDDGA